MCSEVLVPNADRKLQPQSSAASFGSFTDASEAFPDQRQFRQPVSTHAQSARPYHAQAGQSQSFMPQSHSNNGVAQGFWPQHAVEQNGYEDDGFGDFAAAEQASESSTNTAPAAHQSSQPVADR